MFGPGRGQSVHSSPSCSSSQMLINDYLEKPGEGKLWKLGCHSGPESQGNRSISTRSSKTDVTEDERSQLRAATAYASTLSILLLTAHTNGIVYKSPTINLKKSVLTFTRELLAIKFSCDDKEGLAITVSLIDVVLHSRFHLVQYHNWMHGGCTFWDLLGWFRKCFWISLKNNLYSGSTGSVTKKQK